MSNSPIEIMVKLTYNIRGGDIMAEFCLDCWNKINGTEDSDRKYILSKDLDMCEDCGEWKSVIIMKRKAYYKHKLRYFILPIRIICNVIYFIWRLVMLPYLILSYSKSKNKRK